MLKRTIPTLAECMEDSELAAVGGKNIRKYGRCMGATNKLRSPFFCIFPGEMRPCAMANRAYNSQNQSRNTSNC